jgi:hypothetical protein
VAGEGVDAAEGVGIRFRPAMLRMSSAASVRLDFGDQSDAVLSLACHAPQDGTASVVP